MDSLGTVPQLSCTIERTGPGKPQITAASLQIFGLHKSDDVRFSQLPMVVPIYWTQCTFVQKTIRIMATRQIAYCNYCIVTVQQRVYCKVPCLLQAYSAFYWYKQGMDHWKIMVGIPTYARGFSLLTKYLHYDYAPSTGASVFGTSTSYYQVMQCTFVHVIQSHCDTAEYTNMTTLQILSQLGSGYTRVWDNDAKVPYCYKNSDWWSYEDTVSAHGKVNTMCVM